MLSAPHVSQYHLHTLLIELAVEANFIFINGQIIFPDTLQHVVIPGRNL